MASSRSKRPADPLNRAPDPPSKKPRFDARNPSTLAADAPEEDLILDADVIGKPGLLTKRNAVRIEGYESDSDNDNFDARAAERERVARKGKKGKSQDEEEADMFADLEEEVEGGDGDEDEESAGEGKKSKKGVRFLERGEVEGEVGESKAGGHVSADLLLGKGKGRRREGSEAESESSSGDEEERDLLPEEMDEDVALEVGAGGKKKHAPRLDAFNLRDEEEEGRFDESGNFVRKAMDPDAVNDSWLDGLSKKDMKKAREAQEKRDEVRRQKAVDDDAVLSSDSLSVLLSHLETGETPLEALQRLGKGRAKVPKWKQKRQRDGMDVDDENSDADPAETARRKAVDDITGAADALYGREQHQIYDTEREKLMRQYTRETGEDWQMPQLKSTASGDEEWEYRWSDARDGGESHGPYDPATMQSWNAAGYFGDGVEFRRIGERDWSRLLDLG
ncbi:hypothetical protein B0A48_09491 [Cryoendolithus antarcticus]|uniref:GYF domain-containing protein n=1 Tax=Cryoendolithus antarcticus TaxID=1507870 RepID=A0A1V8SZS7_9PEZI|nr:hypothetical protein B0A48_09491 [Cryoendolithus antarcticus]